MEPVVGQLCWFGDNDLKEAKEKKRIGILIGISTEVSGEYNYYRSSIYSSTFWKYCEPLTKDELMEYVRLARPLESASEKEAEFNKAYYKEHLYCVLFNRERYLKGWYFLDETGDFGNGEPYETIEEARAALIKYNEIYLSKKIDIQEEIKEKMKDTYLKPVVFKFNPIDKALTRYGNLCNNIYKDNRVAEFYVDNFLFKAEECNNLPVKEHPSLKARITTKLIEDVCELTNFVEDELTNIKEEMKEPENYHNMKAAVYVKDLWKDEEEENENDSKS